VPAYVGSQLGFNDPGKFYLDNFFYPRLREIGVLPLCPFQACGEYLGPRPSPEESFQKHHEYWKGFNMLIGPINYETLMPHSLFMIAILDGSHSVDEGVAAEVSHFATRYGTERIVVGIRSDFRLAENMAAHINPAVSYFLDDGPYNGHFFFGPGAYERSFDHTKGLADKIRETPTILT